MIFINKLPMKTNTCFELPKHFSRREFMHVGLVEGLGLSLVDFMRIKAHGAQKYYDTVEGPAKGVIHIYFGGMAHQESLTPNLTPRSNTAVLSKASRRKYQGFILVKTLRKRQNCRQNYRMSFDDSW